MITLAPPRIAGTARVWMAVGVWMPTASSAVTSSGKTPREANEDVRFRGADLSLRRQLRRLAYHRDGAGFVRPGTRTRAARRSLEQWAPPVCNELQLPAPIVLWWSHLQAGRGARKPRKAQVMIWHLLLWERVSRLPRPVAVQSYHGSGTQRRCCAQAPNKLKAPAEHCVACFTSSDRTFPGYGRSVRWPGNVSQSWTEFCTISFVEMFVWLSSCPLWLPIDGLSK